MRQTLMATKAATTTTASAFFADANAMLTLVHAPNHNTIGLGQ
jgi:hypothetical protein